MEREYREKIIGELYQSIIKKFSDGTLYGEPINFSDPAEVAVVFYFYGLEEWRKIEQNRLL